MQRDLRAVLASILKGRQASADSAWWSIRPPFAAEVDQGDTLEQVAFQACRSQQLLDRGLLSLPDDQVLVVDYADICRSPDSFVKAAAGLAGNTLRARPEATLPERFTPSPGPGLPRDRQAGTERLIESLEATADDYAARVDAWVTGQTAND